jgi:TRAP-type C4-dicarboxylate transport system permease small subunit
LAEPRLTESTPATPADTHPGGAGGPGEKPGGTAVERWMLVAIVLTMVALPTLETIVRRFTGSGVPGAANYTEHLTLWVGFLGALLATATGHHLALSTVDLLPEGRPRELARALGASVTSLVCAVLAYASIDMILADKDRVDTLPFRVTPAWIFRWAVPLVLLLLRRCRRGGWHATGGPPSRWARWCSSWRRSSRASSPRRSSRRRRAGCRNGGSRSSCRWASR